MMTNQQASSAAIWAEQHDWCAQAYVIQSPCSSVTGEIPDADACGVAVVLKRTEEEADVFMGGHCSPDLMLRDGFRIAVFLSNRRLRDWAGY
jgi:hypothetical protein